MVTTTAEVEVTSLTAFAAPTVWVLNCQMLISQFYDFTNYLAKHVSNTKKLFQASFARGKADKEKLVREPVTPIASTKLRYLCLFHLKPWVNDPCIHLLRFIFNHLHYT